MKKKKIENNLKELDELYNNAQTNKERIFFCKLALVELCGWIEITIDELILNSLKKQINDQTKIEKFNKEYLKRMYGFSYESNIRDMFIKVFGYHVLLDIEKCLNKRNNLKNLSKLLTDLKSKRDSYAHTYIYDFNPNSFEAPSMINGYFNDLIKLFAPLERKIKRIL